MYSQEKIIIFFSLNKNIYSDYVLKKINISIQHFEINNLLYYIIKSQSYINRALYYQLDELFDYSLKKISKIFPDLFILFLLKIRSNPRISLFWLKISEKNSYLINLFIKAKIKIKIENILGILKILFNDLRILHSKKIIKILEPNKNYNKIGTKILEINSNYKKIILFKYLHKVSPARQHIYLSENIIRLDNPTIYNIYIKENNLDFPPKKPLIQNKSYSLFTYYYDYNEIIEDDLIEAIKTKDRNMVVIIYKLLLDRILYEDYKVNFKLFHNTLEELLLIENISMIINFILVGISDN